MKYTEQFDVRITFLHYHVHNLQYKLLKMIRFLWHARFI